MNECRNCGSSAVRDLGFIGEVAPFFLKRVLHMETGFASSVNPLKRLLQSLVAVPQKALSRIRRSLELVELQVCTNCSFVQTKHAFTDEALGCLYRDYRSETYNRERIHYEPTYRDLAARVGTDPRELDARTGALTEWLQGKIVSNGNFSMLDYGGADGRFLPHLPGSKYIYDISEVEAPDGIVSIRSESDLGQYSYVQLAHVLEHVSHPLDLVKKVSKLLAPGAYLYIEVPQDANDSTIAQLLAGTFRARLPIHEHINFYTARSIAKLIESAQLEIIDLGLVPLDLGWITTTNVRGLARRA